MQAPQSQEPGGKSSRKLAANIAMTFLIPIILLASIGLFMKNMFEKTALEQHVTLGQEFFKKEKYQQAQREFEKAINLGANTSEIYGLKASSEFRLGVFDKAAADFDAAAKRDPNSISFVLGRAESNLKLGNSKAAADDASQVLQKNPNSLEALGIRAAAAAQNGDFERTLADIDTYAKTQNPPADLLAARANAYFKSGNRQKAIASYDLAIASSPKTAEYYASKARVLKDLGQYQKAAQSCTAGLKLTPRNVSMLDLRAKCLILANDKVGAVKDIERIVELDPSANVLRTSAESLQALGRSDLAFHYLNKVLEIDPKDAASAKTRDELSMVIKSKQVQVENKAAVPETVEPAPLDVAALKNLSVDELLAKGRAAYGAGSASDAVTILSAAVRKAPSSGEARRLLAFALIGGGNLTAGANEFANLQAISPSGRQELLQFGSKFKGGANPVAISIYEKLLKHDKADVDARIGLIESLTSAGEKAKVVEAAKEGISLATTAQVKQMFQTHMDAASK